MFNTILKTASVFLIGSITAGLISQFSPLLVSAVDESSFLAEYKITVNTECKVISGIPCGTNMTDIVDYIKSHDISCNSDVTGVAVSGNAIQFKSETYTLSTIGDADADGFITASDCLPMSSYFMNDESLTYVQTVASDVNADSVLSSSDYIMLKNAKSLGLDISKAYKNGRSKLTYFDGYDIVPPSWKLEGVPVCDTGKYSPVFNAGPGIFDINYSTESDSVMQIVSGTNAKFHNIYCDKLVARGFICEFNNTIGNNIYASYIKGNMRLYVYYTNSMHQTRIIVDKSSTCSPTDFGYSFNGIGTTQFYQYALTEGGSAFFIFKLKDNSVFLIDGGKSWQIDESSGKGLMDFLREITGTPETEKVRIACWFISHVHADHYPGVMTFLNMYHDSVILERLAHNLLTFNPCSNYNDGVEGYLKYCQNLTKIVNQYYPDMKFLKLHTGENFNIADINITVLYTPDDNSNWVNGQELNTDTNASSVCLRVIMDGKSILLPADFFSDLIFVTSAMPFDAYDCDILQVQHHGYNSSYDIITATKPTVAFVPAHYSEIAGRTDEAKTVYDLLKDNCQDIYFSDKTIGIQVIDGIIKLIDSRDMVD